MTHIELAVKIIVLDEGFRSEPYYCSEGFPTIGYGFRIDGTDRHDPLPAGLRMTRPEADKKLLFFVNAREKVLSSNPDISAAFLKSNDVRKAVMLSIVHQLGLYGLLKFKKYLGAMARGEYAEAGKQLLDSLAARQTPKRWGRNALMTETGLLHKYYDSPGKQ